MQEPFSDELGADAAASLAAPFAMGKPGVLEALLGQAQVAEVSYRSIPRTGRFEPIDTWVTTEVPGWTLSSPVSDERLAALIDTAHVRLGAVQTVTQPSVSTDR
jgi:hypothetical protein